MADQKGNTGAAEKLLCFKGSPEDRLKKANSVRIARETGRETKSCRKLEQLMIRPKKLSLISDTSLKSMNQRISLPK